MLMQMTPLVFKHIPQDFPMQDFVTDIQRNPDIALVYVGWFYWLFSQLTEEQRAAIEPQMERFRLIEIRRA